MKKIRRKTALLLAAALAFSQVACVQAAGNIGSDMTGTGKADGTYVMEETYVNPLYEDVVTESELKTVTAGSNENGIALYSDIDDGQISEEEYAEEENERHSEILGELTEYIAI